MSSGFSLNPQQQTAVDARGKVLVVAGAGSGKTRVLIERIVHLVDDDHVLPSDICAITFTKKAAGEMQDRLIKSLNKTVVDSMQVSTIHSLCNRILQSHYSEWFPKRPRLVKEWEAVKATATGSTKEEEALARTWLAVISRLKSEGILLSEAQLGMSPDDLLDKIRDMGIGSDVVPGNLIPNLLEAWTNYDAWCITESRYDFDDMLVLPWELLKRNETVRYKYQSMWKYVLVDEYQDTSIVQVETIEMIAKDADLFVVGDDDQSIYEWRGAHPELFLGFESRYGDATRVFMEQNYRSGKRIIEVSNQLITFNMDRFQKSLFTEIQDSEVSVRLLSDPMDEAEFVVGLIGELIASSNRQPRDFAVLMRCNYQAAAFEPVFIEKEIPYWPMSGVSFYDRRAVQDVLSYLRLIEDPTDDQAICRIYNRPLRWLGNAWLNAVKAKSRQHGSIWQAIHDNGGVGYGRFSSGEQDLVRMIKTLRSPEFEKPAAAICGVMDLGYRDYMFRNTPKLLESDEDYMGDLSALVSQASNYKTISDFLYAIEQIRKSIRNADPRKKNAVSVGTVHKAKGLEWPVVFVIGFNDGNMPHAKGLLREERNLAYVAFTRAREHLVVSSTMVNAFGKTTQPSFFLNEAGLLETLIPSDEMEEEWELIKTEWDEKAMLAAQEELAAGEAEAERRNEENLYR